MKKLTLLIVTLTLCLVGINVLTTNTADASQLRTVKPDPNAENRTWTYKDNVFDAVMSV